MSVSIKTPAAFQALLKKDPAGAQAWLKKVAAHSDGLLPADQLKALEKVAALKADAFAKGAAGLSLEALFGATPVAAVDINADLPVIHGHLTVERGDRVVVGDQGYREWPGLKMTLTTDDGRKFSLESDHSTRSDIYEFVPGTDIMAFAGQDVSLRGFLDAGGKALRVTEFAPGKVDDFTTGRVVVSGDDVLVRVRGRGMVEVKDRALKAELAQHHNLGVILEGATSEHPQSDGTVKRVFDGKPAEYWMLIRFTEAPTPSGAGKVSGPIQAATSRTQTNVELTPEEAKHIEVNDRMYVLGRFDGGHIKASKATPSAGSPWVTATTERGGAMKSVIEFTDGPAPV